MSLAEEEGGTPFLDPSLVAGPIEVEYAVEALEPADYFFFCSAHPTTMTGTLEVAEGEEPGGGGGGGEGPPTVIAEGVAFDTDTIALPADTESELILDNQDPATPHNIAIYTDDSATESLFVGETFDGIAQETYAIPALAAGEYFFRCDTHPNMSGSVIVEVREGGGDGGGGGGGPPSESPGG